MKQGDVFREACRFQPIKVVLSIVRIIEGSHYITPDIFSRGVSRLGPILCHKLSWLKASGRATGQGFGDQPMRRVGRKEIPALVSRRRQPVAAGPLREDDHHALFLADLVIVAEQRVLIGVDGEHRVALLPMTGRVAVAIPQPRNAQRRAVGPGEAGGYGLAGSPVGFEDGVGGDDAVLRAAPGVAEGEGVGHLVVAGVEGGELLGAGQFVGPVDDEIRPQRPATASSSGTASSPASCSGGRRTNTPW